MRHKNSSDEGLEKGGIGRRVCILDDYEMLLQS
jgi:hypothetical protein